MKTQSILVLLLTSILAFASCDETLQTSCTNNEDCVSFESKSIKSECLSGACECQERKSKEKRNCVPTQSKVINTVVSSANSALNVCPCLMPNTECKENACVCKPGFLITSDKRCVLKTMALGKSCDMDKQCFEFDKLARCESNICHCSENAIEHEDHCYSALNIERNSGCHNESDCHVKDSICLTGKCVCKREFIALESKCLAYANFNESCESSVQCVMGLGSGSICDNEKCSCDKDHTHYHDEGKYLCYRNILYGDNCTEHSDCIAFHAKPEMMCIKNQCTCRDGFELLDAYSKKCVRSEVRSFAYKINPSQLIVLKVASVLVLAKVFTYFSKM